MLALNLDDATADRPAAAAALLELARQRRERVRAEREPVYDRDASARPPLGLAPDTDGAGS